MKLGYEFWMSLIEYSMFWCFGYFTCWMRWYDSSKQTKNGENDG